MTDFTKIGAEQFGVLIAGAILAIVCPLIIAIVWKIRKKEPFKPIIVGAITFILFAIILEKSIQNALVFPITMGLQDHAISQFINARPILWALVISLFPGVFEETGRLVAFKTVLKNRTNRETSISYGIGHGGIEIILVLGIGYIEYLVFAVMINTGTFQAMVDQVAQQAPGQEVAMYSLADQLAALSFADLGMAAFERVFALLSHIGASILVFFAARDSKYRLYILAILLHTALDGAAAFRMAGVVTASDWAMEGIVAVFGILMFFGAYVLLYKRDKATVSCSSDHRP